MATKKAIPQATRRAVALRYGCEPGEECAVECHWCGAPGRIHWHRLYSGRPSAWVSFTLALDHALAESLGGTGDPDNIVLACRDCNSSKGGKVVSEWLASRSGTVRERPSETAQGKGREGKGRGSEVRGSAHHIV